VDSYVEPQGFLFKAKNGDIDFNHTDSFRLVRVILIHEHELFCQVSNERGLQFLPSDMKFHEYMLIYHTFSTSNTTH
jgi:hypothetical protein